MPIRRDALLDLTFINKGGLIGDIKVEGTTDFSDNEMAEFRILRGESQARSKVTALDFRRAEFSSKGIYLKESHGIRPYHGEGPKKVG